MINCLSVIILQVLSPRNGYVLVAKEIPIIMINCLCLYCRFCPRSNGYVLATIEIRVGHELTVYVNFAGSVSKKWLCVGRKGDTSGS